jgi:hypothetical protein
VEVVVDVPAREVVVALAAVGVDRPLAAAGDGQGVVAVAERQLDLRDPRARATRGVTVVQVRTVEDSGVQVVAAWSTSPIATASLIVTVSRSRCVTRTAFCSPGAAVTTRRTLPEPLPFGSVVTVAAPAVLGSAARAVVRARAAQARRRMVLLSAAALED